MFDRPTEDLPSDAGASSWLKESDSKRDQNRPFMRVVPLPCPEWEPNWTRIYVDPKIKSRALNFVLAAYRLGRLGISTMALAQHRALLFQGPPGTGKTSLCRGLSHTAVTQMADQGVTRGVYVEIDSHRLSSELLGKGPKLIEEAFARIRSDFAAPGLRDGYPVMVVVDEIESLASDRAGALNDTNPVDVYRSVNAVITQLDLMAERFPNVFFLATSNLTQAVDPAFRDRLDLELVVGVPDREQRRAILQDVARELNDLAGTQLTLSNGHDAHWERLLELTDGMSGRRLRKLFTESLVSDDEVARDLSRLTWARVEAVAAAWKAN